MCPKLCEFSYITWTIIPVYNYKIVAHWYTKKINISNAVNLNVFICRRCFAFDSSLVVYGLEKVKVVDISGCDFQYDQYFSLTEFRGVETLILSNIKIRSTAETVALSGWFKPVPNVTRLDLSSNSLASLNRGGFRYIQKLQSLNLQDNRFRDIPFDIPLTPRLSHLDLSKNAISEINSKQRKQLDELADQVPELKLNLEENLLSCNCSALPFLYWLENTNVLFENSQIYLFDV